MIITFKQFVLSTLGTILIFGIFGSVIEISNLNNQIDDNEINLKEIIITTNQISLDLADVKHSVEIMSIEFKHEIKQLEYLLGDEE